MTFKGKTKESYVIYSKYRKVKDRNKIRAIKQEQEEDQKNRNSQIKKGNVKDLKQLCSFDKQEASNEFIDFMEKEYPNTSQFSLSLKSQKSDITKSLLI